MFNIFTEAKQQEIILFYHTTKTNGHAGLNLVLCST